MLAWSVCFGLLVMLGQLEISAACLLPGMLSAPNDKISLIIGGDIRTFSQIRPLVRQFVSVLFIAVAKPETWPRYQWLFGSRIH